MAHGRLTKRACDAAKPATFLWDSETRGFGLRVTASGHRSFILQYRLGGRETPTRRVTIGPLGSPWTVELARAEALRLLATVKRDGRDPAAERAAARQDRAARITFDALAADWLERYARPRLRDWRNLERKLGADILPYWRGRDIRALNKTDLVALLDRVTDRGRTIHANRVLALVRGMLAWAVSRGLIEANPAAGIRPPAAEIVRDRVLSSDELAAVWRAAEATPYPFGPAVRLLILTAQRRDEIAGIGWSEIDQQDQQLVIPASRAKNGKAHIVPISKPAMAILAAIPRRPGCDLVFTTNHKTPISGFGKAKARLDRAAGVTGWRLHDLRRTAATGMAKAGVAPHVVDRILNHVSGTIRGVAAVYNRFDYLPERRAALALWGEIVIGGGKVVPLRQASG